MERGKTILAFASVLGKRGAVATRAVGGADDRKRIEAEMAGGHDA